MPDTEQKGARVLIVEDDDIFRTFLSKFFIEKGLDVSLATNGLEGLQLIETKIFDLVITDLRMPTMDGMAFLKNLREQKKSDVTVIILTAYGEMDSYVKAVDWGVFEFLHKPIDVDELSEIVDKALMKKSAD